MAHAVRIQHCSDCGNPYSAIFCSQLSVSKKSVEPVFWHRCQMGQDVQQTDVVT